MRGDPDNPRSEGYLCNKAQSIPSYVHHRDRLTTPLRRRADGGYEAIDWDTAIREIAERLRAVVAATAASRWPSSAAAARATMRAAALASG